jgi:hypothetical protein
MKYNKIRIMYCPTFFGPQAIFRGSGKFLLTLAVSCRLPTAASRVRTQVRSYGFRGGQSGTGAGFLRVLRFPLPILIPPTAPHSSSSIVRGWYNRPNSGRRTKWTQSHPTARKRNTSMTSKYLTSNADLTSVNTQD